jgi:hypothetical protein
VYFLLIRARSFAFSGILAGAGKTKNNHKTNKKMNQSKEQLKANACTCEDTAKSKTPSTDQQKIHTPGTEQHKQQTPITGQHKK